MRYAISIIAALFAATPVHAEPLQPVPAASVEHASAATMLDATWAGERIVAVGDHGVVLFSDDRGVSFQQSASVPLSTPLTGVSFADARHGWAVGHWGAILATADGGGSWQIQRLSSEEDRPLFAVHFFDAQRGVAVGLWSLVLTTDDGGRTWQEQSLPPPPGFRRADLNLMGLFADQDGHLYATAERGQLLRSSDRGRSWNYLDTGYEGTLWAGVALADGRLLVGGQRGTLLHGSADGLSWQRVPLQSKSSITAITVSGRRVAAAGLDGLMVSSSDGGRTFEEQQAADGSSLTAALFIGRETPLLFSRRGVIALPGS